MTPANSVDMTHASLKEIISRKCRKVVLPMEPYDEEEEEEAEATGEDVFGGMEEELPLQDILADKRRKYSVKEEFMYLLYNDLLQYFTKSWEGTVLRKKLRKKFSEDLQKEFDENEDSENKEGYDSSKEFKRNDSYNSYGSEMILKPPWKLILPDEFANITFINGNTYSGRISRKMMEGEGLYKWANGTHYKGELQQNQMHGTGLLQWHNNCWYKGDFENCYQHGKGLYVDSENRFMYTGQWLKGRRHGKGYARYQDNSSYDGDWVTDRMCGLGLRIYPDGSRYMGQWKYGLRHGSGTMVWANGDVYRGEWKRGSMNGYGVFVWNAFFNKTFTWPQETSYEGCWHNGKRHGKGQIKFNTIGGAKYSGYWKNNKKHGPGVIIGNNGDKIEADPLYENDILIASDIACIQDQSASDGADRRVPLTKESKSSFVEMATKLRITPITPVLRPEQFPSLSYYIARLLDPKSLEDSLIRSVPSGKCYVCDDRSCSCLTSSSSGITESEEQIDTTKEMEDSIQSEREYEERWTYNCLTMHMLRLREIYANFAKLFSISPPDCNLVMYRMCLWQFWRDCKVHEKGLSLIEIDNYIAKNESTIVKDPHDPFEKIEIWQFLHSLLEVSWHLYGKSDNSENHPEINGKLAGSLHKFLKNDVYPNVENHTGSLCLEYTNLLPMSSVFKLNQSIGYPCSAKDLLRATCIPKGTEYSQPSSVHDKMTKHLPNGVNAITIGDRMSYLLKVNDIFTLPHQKTSTLKHYGSNQTEGLLIFKELRATKMFEIIASVCSGVKDPNNGIIINMDYEISFLEFYEIILEAAKQLLCIRNEASMQKKNNESESSEK